MKRITERQARFMLCTLCLLRPKDLAPSKNNCNTHSSYGELSTSFPLPYKLLDSAQATCSYGFWWDTEAKRSRSLLCLWMQLLETERARGAALKWLLTLLTQPKHAAQESRGAEQSRPRSRSRGRARARGPRIRAHPRCGAAPRRGLGLRRAGHCPRPRHGAHRPPGAPTLPGLASPHRSAPASRPGAPRRGALGGERAESRAAPGAWEAVRPRPGMPEPRRTRAGSRRLRGSGSASSPLAPARRPRRSRAPPAATCRPRRAAAPSLLPPAGRSSGPWPAGNRRGGGSGHRTVQRRRCTDVRG